MANDDLELQGIPLAIMLFAAGASYREVAEKCGVSTRTATRWWSKWSVRRAAYRQRARLLSLVTCRSAALLDRVSETLQELLGDPLPNIRLGACRAICDLVAKGVERDIFDERLTKIERRIKRQAQEAQAE